MALAELVSTLMVNPYFSAGFALFGVGTVAAAGRAAAQVSLTLGRRHLVTSLQVPCNDRAYTWFLDWLGKEGGQSIQHISVRTEWEEEEGGKVRARYSVEPSPGVHLLRWKGVWIKLERIREQQQVDVIGGVPWETLTLTSFGRRRNELLQMLEEARDEVLTKHKGKTTIYTCTGSEWREMGSPQDSRPLETVVMEEAIPERLAEDCSRFLASGSWYKQRGVPHRRGILLYGPPGCGKTSLIVALAGHLQLGISILSLSDSNMTDNVLQARLADVPRNTILLLEDIDAAFISRDSSDRIGSAYSGQSSVTLTGLLNGLDGAVSSEGRLTFLTTNYLERLDPALIRPGRVDLKQYIGFCSRLQCERLFTKFFPERSEEEAASFATQCLLHGEVSPAQIQAHLLLHQDNPVEAIQSADNIKNL